MNQQLRTIRQEITKIKCEIASLPPLRPGSICRQYRHPTTQAGPYYQLSYTHQGKSRTEHVYPEERSTVEAQLAAYHRLMELVKRWIELGIEECRLVRAQHRAGGRRSS